MNREILFRAQKKYSKEWIFGYIVNSIQFDGWFIDFHKNGKDHSEEINPETIGQFTGLTDKKGVKIFEGDVLLCKKATEPEEKGFECVFKDNAFRFVNRNYPNKEHFNIKLDEYDYIKEQLEIIGNIHE